MYPPAEVAAAAWRCAVLCCTPDSKRKLLVLFYLRCRKAMPAHFLEECPSSGVVLMGRRGFPYSPLPGAALCCPAHAPRCWRGTVKFGRGVDFVSGRCLLPSQRKLNTRVPWCCQTPVTSSNLLRSLGSIPLGGQWRGGVRVWECRGGFQVPLYSLQQFSGKKRLVAAAPKSLDWAGKAGILFWRDTHLESLG